MRTLAGNFQLLQLGSVDADTTQNRVLFQLISHKIMRLLVPYFFNHSACLSHRYSSINSRAFTAFAALQVLGWAIALIALRNRIPILDRVAAPASALLVLNAAAVVGLYKFLFTSRPALENLARDETARHRTAS